MRLPLVSPASRLLHGTASMVVDQALELPLLVQAGILAPVRPDRLVRMADAVRRYGVGPATACAASAARFGDATALADERGTLSFRELEDRTSDLAAGLADLDLPDDVRARYDTSALRIVHATGSAMGAPLAQRALDEYGDVLYSLYGSTEVAWVTIATPRTCAPPPAARAARPARRRSACSTTTAARCRTDNPVGSS